MWSNLMSYTRHTNMTAMLNRWLHAALSPAVTYDINDDLPWTDLLFNSPFFLSRSYTTD